MSQLAVAWCLKNESVNCLLLGATSVEQFKENIHALQASLILACSRVLSYLLQSFTRGSRLVHGSGLLEIRNYLAVVIVPI